MRSPRLLRICTPSALIVKGPPALNVVAPSTCSVAFPPASSVRPESLVMFVAAPLWSEAVPPVLTSKVRTRGDREVRRALDLHSACVQLEDPAGPSRTMPVSSTRSEYAPFGLVKTPVNVPSLPSLPSLPFVPFVPSSRSGPAGPAGPPRSRTRAPRACAAHALGGDEPNRSERHELARVNLRGLHGQRGVRALPREHRNDNRTAQRERRERLPEQGPHAALPLVSPRWPRRQAGR